MLKTASYLAFLLLADCVLAFSTPTTTATAKLIQPVRWGSELTWASACLLARRGELKLGRDVELRPSEGKGLGVFARVPIRKGALLGRYRGDIYSGDEYFQAYEAGLTSGEYLMQLADDCYIDGEDPSRSYWTRYVNHSLRRANCKSYSLKPLDFLDARLGSVYFEAIKDIEPGEELLVDYGEEYWDHRVGKFSLKRLMIDHL